MRKLWITATLYLILTTAFGQATADPQRQQIAQKILTPIIAQQQQERSYLVLMSPDQQTKVKTVVKNATIDFYAQNMTLQELQQLDQCLNDKVFLRLTQQRYDSIMDVDEASLQALENVIIQYPVLNKVIDETFQKNLQRFIHQRLQEAFSPQP